MPSDQKRSFNPLLPEHMIHLHCRDGKEERSYGLELNHAKYIHTKTSQLIIVIFHDQIRDRMDGPLANCGMDTGRSQKGTRV